MIRKVEREHDSMRDEDLLKQIAMEVEQQKITEETIEEEETVSDYTIVED